MVDREVAEILAEIKRRVSSEQGNSISEPPGVAENTGRTTSRPAVGNGFANLPIMERAWDRLPPLLSNRSGSLAKLELWLKRTLKRASRWFTWEQVNFNAAAYQTFVELVDSLNACEQRLAAAQQHFETQLVETKQQLNADFQDQYAALSSLTAQLTSQVEQLDRQHLVNIAQLNARVEGLSQLAKDHQAETQARLAELVAEFRLRNEGLLDEQRVCYRQLLLELSESRVLQDRARRELETRVAKLECEK